MFSQLLILTGVFSRLAAADSLSLWLGTACNGADEGFTEPLPLGTCIEFDQAQSFILEKDDGNVYNLYSGGGCAQFVGEVALSGTCQAVGDSATGVINIGPQSSKRWIRYVCHLLISLDVDAISSTVVRMRPLSSLRVRPSMARQ
jgi:hypothetical protein